MALISNARTPERKKKSVFTAVLAGFYLCAIVCGLMVTGQAAAEQPAADVPAIEETTFGAWRRVCTKIAANKRYCGLAYGELPEDAKSGFDSQSPLIAVTIQRAAGGKGSPLLLLFRTRLGLLLPGGLELKIDGKRPVKAAFRSCHATRRDVGCIVPVTLAGAFLRNVKAGLSMKVGATTLQGSKIEQTVSLVGVTDAVEGLPRE